MTDGAALLAAILANPDDDAPRLVYADWLDEHAAINPCPACIDKSGFCWGKVADCRTCHGVGEVLNGFAERAEFIRVQCALADMEREPNRRKLDPKRGVYAIPGGQGLQLGFKPTLAMQERDALRRRERELKDWMPDHWGRGEDNQRVWGVLGLWGYGTCNWDWQRGFIGQFTCTAADWLTHADAITAAHPVREVKLMTRTHPMAEVSEIWGEWTRQLGDRLTFSSTRWPGITFHLPEPARYPQEYLQHLGQYHFDEISYQPMTANEWRQIQDRLR